MPRTPAPECPRCGMGMRSIYIHSGASRRQRTLRIGWICMNCKEISLDYPVTKYIKEAKKRARKLSHAPK